ncbi:hypothetical protein GCM10022255_094450 [Dactylosporangium darangshiense]|uniref:Uncharacterized protein n=1 Tax=Dactylosporangium darangshiense TaxID=579108 RepID=A0ABP8DQ38_9ACTN
MDAVARDRSVADQPGEGLDEQVLTGPESVGTAKDVDHPFVTTDINTLLTALDVKIDDWLGDRGGPGGPRTADAQSRRPTRPADD